MIPGTLLPAIGTFAATWWKLAVGAVLGALLCFPLAYCEGKDAAADEYKAARAEANVEAMKRNEKAASKAAEQRVKDATEVAENERELIDAIAQTPDTAPDAKRVALGCARLRAQGTAPADLPAVCGP